MNIHVVNRGETLYSIARRYGVSPNLLALNNGINRSLAVGETLVILYPKVVHTAVPGDSIYSIAAMHGTTVRNIYKNNIFLKGSPDIFAGQTIVIEYSDTPLRSAVSNGYAYDFINRDTLNTALPYLTFVSPFTYGITESGNLVIPNDEYIRNRAANYGTSTLLHLSTLSETGGFDSGLAEFALNNQTVRDRLINEISRVVYENRFSGVDVDFEFIGGENAESYGRFLNALRSTGLFVIVAAAPKTSSDQPGSLYEGHDYAVLGQSADFVMPMLYEWGYTYGPPMAVAPLPQVKRALDYALSEIPPQKILMGIPNYGYDWTLPFVSGESKARSIGNSEAVNTAIRYGAEIKFDETAASPYFNYTDEYGRTHEVWFEDARSIQAKFELLINSALAGMGYWNIMRPFPQLWLLQNALFT